MTRAAARLLSPQSPLKEPAVSPPAAPLRVHDPLGQPLAVAQIAQTGTVRGAGAGGGDTEWVGVTYWNARREAIRLADGRRWIPHWRKYIDAGHASRYLTGRWEDRSWLNVPGPFYGAETDTCATGRLAAPSNVLYTEEGEEFIWKQPQNPEQVRAVLDAAYQDPFLGYAWDGDDHWTGDLVRQWWAERGRTRDWIERQLRDERLLNDPYDKQAVVDGLREFKSYLDGALELHLRVYLLWLETGRRRATERERLPDL